MRKNRLKLLEAELLDEMLACPFCGEAIFASSHLLQKVPDVWMRNCRNCGASSVSRFPHEDYLSYFYEVKSKKLPMYEETMSLISSSKNMRRTGRYIYKKLNRNFSGVVKVLDFGGNTGEISYSVAESILERNSEVKEVEITVVDLNVENFLKKHHSQIKMKAVTKISNRDDKFDIVIASGIIEHLSYPLTVIKELLELMHSEGLFYIRVPYMLPIAKLASFFCASVDLLYPAHLHDLGQKFWEESFIKLLNVRGVELIYSRPSLVQTMFSEFPVRTSLALLVKLPWHLLSIISKKYHYPFVGSWEVVLRKG